MSDSFVTPWTVACQDPLSVRFPRQEYCSGLPFLSPEDLPNQETELTSPALVDGFFTTEPPGKPCVMLTNKCTKTLVRFISQVNSKTVLLTSLCLSS